jgi:3-oxoacyl-[acyl-carrier protein] reductase
VVGYGHNEIGALETVHKVEAKGRRAWLSQMDLGSPDSVNAGIEQIKIMVGHLDVMVLCAGENIIQPWQETTLAQWNKVFGINLTGPFFLIKGLAPLMCEGSSIVTVASVAAQTGAPHHLHYAAAKAGVINLTKSFARGLAPKIRVNCVAPGVTLTAMGEDTLAVLAPDYAQKKIPVQRYASAEEMARCIVFVASPITGFMTGATVDINGGREMR